MVLAQQWPDGAGAVERQQKIVPSGGERFDGVTQRRPLLANPQDHPTRGRAVAGQRVTDEAGARGVDPPQGLDEVDARPQAPKRTGARIACDLGRDDHAEGIDAHARKLDDCLAHHLTPSLRGRRDRPRFEGSV